MLYYHLKYLHIIGAIFLITSMAYCLYNWYYNKPNYNQILYQQTGLLIIPLAFIQLLTGFTIISIKKELLGQFWIGGSAVGFMLVVSTWLGFVFLNQRKLQRWMLILCTVSLLFMIFIMTNKIA